MKHIILSLLLYSFLQVNAQEYAVSKIPEALKENAHTVIRKSSTVFQVNSPKSATETVHLVATILNDKSDFNQLYVFYDKFRTVKSIQGFSYDQNGKMTGKSKKSDINDYSANSGISIYEDNRVKALGISSNRYPYTVEFVYTVEHKGIQDYPDWLPLEDYEVGVEASSFKIIMPQEMNLRYQARNTAIKAEITEDAKGKVYHWSANNLPAVKSEELSPRFVNYSPIVYYAPEEFEVDGYKGNMSNWKTFGDFIYDLNKDRGNLSPEMKQTVQKLVATASSPEEKIAILYDYLQENTRYVSVQFGIGGWQTFPAEYVEKNKYGDCKALTYFMRAMLEEAGVDAYAALIYAGSQSPEIREDFAEPMFNHVILYVPAEETWLECTSTYSPPNFLGRSTENRKALLLKPGDSQLISTPKSVAKENTNTRTIKVHLAETGAAKVNISSQITGHLQTNIRYNSKTLSEEDLSELLIKRLPFSGFQLVDFAVDPSEEKPLTNVEMNVNIDKYASVSGSRMFFKPNLLSDLYVPEKMDQRTVPILKNSPRIYQEKTVFTIPKGYQVESKPKERYELDTEFGHYISEVIIKDNQITYKRYLELHSIDLPADRYNDMRDFYLKVARADKAKIALVNKD